MNLIITFVIYKIPVMKERLIAFLKNENKSSAQLAEEIGVQASGISHILSGRNNPSLDFVLKMLEKYKYLSTDWLLFGKGSMYKEPVMHDLFDTEPSTVTEDAGMETGNGRNRPEMEIKAAKGSQLPEEDSTAEEGSVPEVVRIVWFYEDRSFKEYFPLK